MALLLAAQPIEAEQAGNATLEISITGARNDKGLVRIAVCPKDSGFPDCKSKAVRSASIALSGKKAAITFTGIPAGEYAVGVFHDANSNSKLDTFLGIPREGFGFSRNPAIKPRAPRFSEAVITIENRTEAAIKLRYML